MVVSVDEDKGYINLSKKRVANEDVQPKQDISRWNQDASNRRHADACVPLVQA